MKQEASSPTVVGINCIYIPASNIKRSADWYVNNLHLTLLNEVNESSKQAQLQINREQQLFLIKTKENLNLNYQEVDGNRQCFLTLEVTNIEELHKQLADCGVTVEEIQDQGDCGINFYLEDPDGNLIDIWGGWPKLSLERDLVLEKNR